MALGNVCFWRLLENRRRPGPPSIAAAVCAGRNLMRDSIPLLLQTQRSFAVQCGVNQRELTGCVQSFWFARFAALASTAASTEGFFRRAFVICPFALLSEL